MANTKILIKRSTTTTTPATSSLQAGELAYSYLSNTAFIGNSDGIGVLKIGGASYTAAIDAATTSNTASTIVKRDVNGSFSGNLIGNATSSSSLNAPQNFSISGGDIAAATVAFSGNNAVALNASLNAVPGLTAGSVGSSSSIPVIAYGANGRILSVSSASIGTATVTVSGNTGTDTFGSTLTFQGGGTGITTIVSGAVGAPIVTINTDNTVLRANTSVGTQIINSELSIPSNNVSIGGTLTVSNLNVSGAIIQTNATSTMNVNDPIMYLAANNSGNAVDIGMVGHFVGQGTSTYSHYQHTGFVRDFNDNKWKLFSNVSSEPTTTVVFDATTLYDVIKTGGLDASGGNITSANSITAVSLALTTALPVASGGIGINTLPANQILLGSGTNAIQALANVTAISATSITNNQTLSALTTDTYGRVLTFTTQAIGGLTVSQGGTGNTAFTAGSILVGNGTGALSVLANTTYTATGSAAYNNTITSLTVDAYGRLTAATYSAISGLTVTQGGTGLTTATTNGITFGNGASAIGVTAAAGTADQTFSTQILTATNAGVPIWASALDGGQF